MPPKKITTKTKKITAAGEGKVKVKAARAASHPSRVYRNIALSFIFVALVLIFVIFYFSYTRATIIVTAKKEKVETSLIATIDSTLTLASPVTAGNGLRLPGRVIEIKEEGGDTFSTSPEATLKAQASGQAIIYNRYSKAQPLIATTRLLAPDGKLFRLRDYVLVPAGGQVEEEIYADQPGPEGEIGPSRLTIPGLWTGIQDRIYVETTKPLTGGTRKSRALTQADVDHATTELAADLSRLAKQEIKSQLRAGEELVEAAIKQEIIETAVDKSLGEETPEFSLTMRLRVIAVVFNQEDLLSFARERLKSQVPEGKELAEVDLAGVTFGIQEYNLSGGTATLRLTVPGVMRIQTNHPLLNKAQFMGLSADEVKAYLKNFESVEQVETRFNPFWMDKVPNLRDHIIVIVK